MYQNRTDGRAYPCIWCEAITAGMECPERKTPPLTTEEIHEKIENWRASKKQSPEDTPFDQYGRVDWWK